MSENDIKRNGSGYYDPTAYFAIKNMERDKKYKYSKNNHEKNKGVNKNKN